MLGCGLHGCSHVLCDYYACAVHVCACGVVSVVLAASPYVLCHLTQGKVSRRMFHTMHEGMFIDSTDTGDVGCINATDEHDIKCDIIILGMGICCVCSVKGDSAVFS